MTRRALSLLVVGLGVACLAVGGWIGWGWAGVLVVAGLVLVGVGLLAVSVEPRA